MNMVYCTPQTITLTLITIQATGLGNQQEYKSEGACFEIPYVKQQALKSYMN